MGYDIIPEIKNYTKFADSKIQVTNHGGVVAYVHNSISSHVFDVIYETCFISLRIDLVPQFNFIGVYIQPENSPYFTTSLFCNLSSFLMTLNERDIIPVMGGDLNCRFGKLNTAFHVQFPC